METYPRLVSSQIPQIYYFIYLCSKTIIVLCNILNSKNIAGNIFVNEQCHRKLMFSGDIELNPGPVLHSVRCYQLKYLYILVLHIRVYNN
jgi:hypothetical protein